MAFPVLLKDHTELQMLSISELEALFGFEYLARLEFEEPGKVQRYLAKALKKRDVHLREKFIGAFYAKEYAADFCPPLSIRWVNAQIGYGVFAEKDLPPNTYIGEYTGIVRKRFRFQRQNRDYCFDYTLGPFTIDALPKGNITRFINHSDTPNLVTTKAYFDESLHIIFFVKQKISAGTQITYDYGEDYWKKRLKVAN